MDEEEAKRRRPEVGAEAVETRYLSILGALAEFGLDWVVAAIASEAEDGKTVARSLPLQEVEGARQRLSADTLMTIPLDEWERLQVAVDTVRRVLVEPALMERDLLSILGNSHEPVEGDDGAGPITVTFESPAQNDEQDEMALVNERTLARVQVALTLAEQLDVLEKEVYSEP